MTTIYKGMAAALMAALQSNGLPVAIPTGSTVQAKLLTLDGVTELAPPRAVDSAAPGSDWTAGLVAAVFTDVETAVLDVGDVMLVITSSAPAGTLKRFKVHVEDPAIATRSQLFVRDFIVDELRNDRLLAAAGAITGGPVPSDDYIWDKLRAAESEIGHQLRVPLVPTMYFPVEPTVDELAALPPGMPWGIDPGHDIGPSDHRGDRWGMITTRQKPIIEIHHYRFAYPTNDKQFYDIPLEWLRPDKRYGRVSVVPTSYSISVPLSGIVLSAIAGGRTVPLMLQVTYTAGLENAARDYPELLDAIKKLAVLKIIEDTFAPQSGSISADGLSQSMSMDMEKYRDTIDNILNGGKGSNGGLMALIHGVRVGFLGS